MPLDRDLVDIRISDICEAINELKRLTSKSFSDMSIDEKYSMRYNIIVLVESLAFTMSLYSIRALWIKTKVLC
uniref:DUF86 domain-containing protein n=1 Tax=Ignisphaera aggregans TaxID=334771 RepID=A0A7C5YSW3_9CREN